MSRGAIAGALLVTAALAAALLEVRNLSRSGHARLSCALAATQAGQLVGLVESSAPPGVSAAFAAALRVLGPDCSLHGDAAAAAERDTWAWVSTPQWCSAERSTRGGVVWWDVVAHGAAGNAVVLWLDGVTSPPAPPRIACHWASALGARFVVPELSLDQPTSQLIMQLHRSHRRLAGETGAPRVFILATSPSASWLALTSTLRLLKAKVAPGPAGDRSGDLPAAGLALVSPLADLELDVHASFRAGEPVPGDCMTAAALRRAAHAVVGRDPDPSAASPSPSTLRRMSPAWQEVAGLPPVLLAWDEKELLADVVTAFASRLRNASVPVTELSRSGLGNGHLRRAPWTTPEGRADMRAIAAFLRQCIAGSA